MKRPLTKGERIVAEMAVGDNYTPPNTAAKLLRKYDYNLLYKQHHIDVTFTRTNRKRLINLRKQ